MIRQYLNTLYAWSAKAARTNGKSVYWNAFTGAFKMHPIFRFGKGEKAQLSQFKRILKKAKIEKQSGRFFYSLDENVCPVYAGRVIDNMPVDYALVVNHGLKECSSPVAAALREYIDRTGDARLQKMQDGPAETLFDALQRILFYNQILWQTGHTLNGLGRLDKILANYEPDEELLKEFLQTLHRHYNFKSSAHLGDTGQIIILGGTEADGSVFCNEYTKLFIDCMKQLHLPDPKCLLRVNKATDENLLKAAAESIATGIGSPLLSNDDTVIPALEEFGYEHGDACHYGVSACWEPLAIGCSLEQNNLTDIEFGKILYDTVQMEEFLACSSEKTLLALYERKLSEHISEILRGLDATRWEFDPALMFMFPDGMKYKDYGILSVGLSSAVNSILNISRYVYSEKKFGAADVAQALKENYKGYDEMRLGFSEHEEGFGSASEKALKLTKDILDYTASRLEGYVNPLGGRVKFGLSSPAYIRIGQSSPATADGRSAGDPFDEHISGHGDSAATDVMLFASKLDYSGVRSNGNVVDVMMPASLIKNNLDKFCSYLKSSIGLGIFQMQFNMISLEELLDAKANPEAHRDLIVRVWGFSAYFVDLPEEYQNTLIARARELESA